jgi:hypothetical protein
MISKANSPLAENTVSQADARENAIEEIVHIPTKGCPYDKANVYTIKVC